MTILLFLLINFSVFLPTSVIYLITRNEAFSKTDNFKFTLSVKVILKFFYKRPGADLFRIVFDYSLFCFLLLFFEVDAEISSILLSIICVLSWVDVTYTNVMVRQFKRAPLLYSDLDFIKAGLLIAKNKRTVILAGVVALLAFLLIGYYFLNLYLIQNSVFSIWMVLVLLVISFGTFYHFSAFPYVFYHERIFYSPIIHLIKNVRACARFDLSNKFTDSKIKELNTYIDVSLKDKPNVYLINVESYGGLLYEDAFFRDVIKGQWQKSDKELEAGGWHVTTKLSKAPIFAGGSWMSMATFFYGIKIDNGMTFNSLFRTSKKFSSYESLLHFLKRQEYFGALLCPLGGGYSDYIEWDRLKEMYRIDEFIHEECMQFKGQTFKFMDFGYTPPDQYSISFARQHLSEKAPYFVIFPTLNSHYKWNSPIELVGDWRTLNDPETLLEPNQEKGNERKYLASIQYQLKFLTNFILTSGDENAVFVLFGDHQPPFITKESAGNQTPVHVISKNSELIADMVSNGFHSGFDNKNIIGNYITHESFYSRFMKSFVKYYGSEVQQSFSVKPQGAYVH